MIQDLAKFLPEGPATDRWLLIDSSKYLKQLRRQLPKARITAVTRFEEVPELQEFQDLSIEWHVLDYRLTELPFADAAFDHIVAAPCLEEAYEPYETMLAISRNLLPPMLNTKRSPTLSTVAKVARNAAKRSLMA